MMQCSRVGFFSLSHSSLTAVLLMGMMLSLALTPVASAKSAAPELESSPSVNGAPAASDKTVPELPPALESHQPQPQPIMPEVKEGVFEEGVQPAPTNDKVQAPIDTAKDGKLSAGVSYLENGYRLAGGDIVSFHVYRADELSQDRVLVRSDGKASFKGVGEVDVLDKTPAEVELILEQRLSDLIRKPIVTVAVTQTRPGIVYLTGAVQAPGMHEFSTSSEMPGTSTGMSSGVSQNVMRSDFKLSNILANAGGVKMNADLGNVEVRSADGKSSMKVDLWDMLESGNSSQDVTVHPGDTIHVPELSEMALEDQKFERLLGSTVGPKTIPVRLVGSLNLPGLVELDGKSPYLNSAIAKAGGFTPNANRKAIAIRRRVEDGQLATLYVNPGKFDMTLRPNDVVYVVDTNFSKVSDGGNKISKMFSPLSNFASMAFAVRYFTRD